MSSSHRNKEERSDSPIHAPLSGRSGNAYSMSHVPTQKESASTHDSPTVRRAKSHHPSKAEEVQCRPTRPTREMTRGPTRMHTARTAFTRQRTNMSRQQTGLSKTQSRQGPDPHAVQAASKPQDADVDPEYYEYNPWYGQGPDEPIFGVNKPLPRTVRPGMRRRKYILEEAEEEEDQIEAAQANFGPNDEPDLEKGQSHQHTRRSEDNRGRHSKSFEQKPYKSENRSEDYFDQTPDRSRSAHGIDVPVLPPGEEPGEKEDIPSTFPGQTGLWQSSRPRHEGASRQSSRAQQDRGRPATVHEDYEIEDFPSHPHGQRHNSQRLHDASHSSSATQIGDSREEENSGADDDNYDFSEQDHQALVDRSEIQADYSEYRTKWSRFRAKTGKFWAELWGTTIAVCLGLCVNFSVTVSKNQTNQFGSYETQCWGWGFAFMIGIFLSAGVSGAHLNPVITIVFTFFRGSPFWRGVYFIIAQLLGGLFGGGLAYLVFQDALNAVDPSHDAKLTGTAFYPGPQSAIPMSSATAFFSEFVATMILIMVILAMGDDQNAPPGAGLAPLIIAFVIATLMMCFGYNTGPALSPARDLGPRLIAYFRDYSENPFANGYWAWGACGATVLGGLTGAVIYDLFFFTGSESPINYHFISPNQWKKLWIHERRVDTVGPLCGFIRSIDDKVFRGKVSCFCGGYCEETEHEVKHGLEKTRAIIKREKRKAKARAQKGTRKITGGFTAN